MATLLKIGEKTINFDQVFEIEDYGDRMRVFYAVTSSDTVGARQPAYAELAGPAAAALRRWIAARAEDLGVDDLSDRPDAADAGQASTAAAGFDARDISESGYEPATPGRGEVFDPRHET